MLKKILSLGLHVYASSRVNKANINLSLVLVVFLTVSFISVTNYMAPSAGASAGVSSPPPMFADYPGSSWQTATPQEVGMDPVKFAAAMSLLPSPSVVIRNGRIVGQKGDISRTGYTWSGSKSLVALIYARLLQQGRIANYDVIVPNSNIPTNPPATFRQFLSMTSDYNLSPHSPGNHYAYNNGAVHFYGTYLKNTYYPGQTEVQMLREAYGSTVGLQDPVSYKGYLGGWDGGWSMSTRDLARVAYLVLRNGNWNGQQIVPASFVDDLYRNQIPSTATQASGGDDFHNESPTTSQLPGSYSFGFWVLPGSSGQSRTEATTMLGAFGTTAMISRSTDLVIVAVNTSGNHGGGQITGSVLDAFAASIGVTSTPTPTPTPTPNPTPMSPSGVVGRIAISSDGNDHDCDDITATPMSIALLAKTGNASKLVYYGHSDHIWSTGTDGLCLGGNREEEMRISSQETARLWGGFNLNVFINAKAQTATAVSNLASQINASSASNPLWIIGAGPMEVIGRALQASDPAKRQYVTVVSHSDWNDFHAEEPGHGTWNYYELGSVLGANLRHIIDQNAGLKVHESNYQWLQQSSDPKLNWLWQRHLISGTTAQNFDPSDAGMIYWLITGGSNGGDQNATPAKLRAILESSAPTPSVTLSAALVTAPEGSVLQSVTNGTTINLAALPTRSLSISLTPSAPVGSMKIQHNGNVRTENVAPYSLAGDTNGAYNPANLTVGTHTVIATPYPLPDAGGTAGPSMTIVFSIVDSPVTSPTPTPTPTPTPVPTPTPTPSLTVSAALVTAPEGGVLQGVTNGTTINLATLPTRSLSISLTPTVTIGSLKIQHNTEVRTENIAPYSLAGDTNGAFTAANMSVGTHTVIATPYPLANAGGTPGPSTTIVFSVVDNSNVLPPVLVTQENSDRAVAFNAATFLREPFAVFTDQNFSTDKRTRLVLFASELDITLGGDATGVQVLAENGMIGSVQLPIEHIGKVPFFNWLTQIQVVLPDVLANTSDVWLRVRWRGLSSNQTRITIRQGQQP